MKTENIEVTNIKKLINSVYLDGLIEECIMKVDDVNISIQAVDMANTLFVSCEYESPFDNIVDDVILGLGDLGMLAKYFGMVGGDKVNIAKKGNTLTVRWPKHGSLNYLLTDPDVIPNSVDDEGATDNFRETTTHTIAIKDAFCKNFLSFISISKTELVTFQLKDSKAYLRSGSTGEHKFTIPMGTVKGKKPLDTKVDIYGTHLTAIIKQLEFGEGAGGITMGFGKGKPIVITQDERLWALLPIEMGS